MESKRVKIVPSEGGKNISKQERKDGNKDETWERT